MQEQGPLEMAVSARVRRLFPIATFEAGSFDLWTRWLAD